MSRHKQGQTKDSRPLGGGEKPRETGKTEQNKGKEDRPPLGQIWAGEGVDKKGGKTRKNNKKTNLGRRAHPTSIRRKGFSEPGGRPWQSKRGKKEAQVNPDRTTALLCGKVFCPTWTNQNGRAKKKNSPSRGQWGGKARLHERYNNLWGGHTGQLQQGGKGRRSRIDITLKEDTSPSKNCVRPNPTRLTKEARAAKGGGGHRGV